MALRNKKDYDAIVVGSGPNGLSAAIVLQKAGLSTLLIEARPTLGGGLRSAALTLPGFTHDICSAIHPMAAASPFFNALPLHQYGLQFINPPIAVAHPFDDGEAAWLMPSLHDTAAQFEKDGQPYLDLIGKVVEDWSLIKNDLLGPLRFPKHPLAYARFGLNGLRSAQAVSKRFATKKVKGLWAGLAAHSILPLANLSTAAIGMVLAGAAHVVNWPIPKGGSQCVADALSAYFISLGGKVETSFLVQSLQQLPAAHALLFDVGPKQLLHIAGHDLSAFYKWQLKRFRYGMGVFKIDWALSNAIPFTAAACRSAGTVHIGNTMEEVSEAENGIWKGRHAEKPFVLLAQQSLFDDTRAPSGKHAAWAYCHVPRGSTKDMTNVIEQQVERFAPGFRDTIIARHTMNTQQLEAYNENYYGGDIGGGALDITQLFTRPALRFSPYRSSAKGIYLCSSSTPPGGGVHGMCGYHAACRVLKDIFKLDSPYNIS